MNVLEQIVANCAADKAPTEPLRVLGIDLGTTNSTVAEIVFDPAHPEATAVRCLAVEQPTAGRGWWNPLVPSIVALHDGKEIVGEGARQLRTKGRELGLIDKGSFFAGCKNDMGLRRTYNMAPDGYRSAAEVSGRLLAFLRAAALKDKPLLPTRTTVTVPASFQAAQRHDTRKAAELAGLNIQGGDLLDEPVAAFIGYLCEYPDKVLVAEGETKHLLVFDFGGGTCDVAIFRLSRDLESDRLNVASLAVSRYHRLGGGDIDQAIIYDVLIPQLLEQNKLNRRHLDFDLKKTVIEPAFIGIAEELKAGLCDKMHLAIMEGDDIDGLVHTCPGEYVCKKPQGGTLTLTNPQLTGLAFQNLLNPFLDTDLLCLKENEYRQTLSIFTPIRDALESCGLGEDEIDLCLLAGGSCLIPQVHLALCEFFDNAEVLTFANADASQMAVARGAVVNALSLALCGQPVIQPVCQETIAIVTSKGPCDLVPKGARLPWPAGGGFEQATILAMPQNSCKMPVSIQVEVVACEKLGHRSLMRESWQVMPPFSKGDRILLKYRYDENQVLEMHLSPVEFSECKSSFKGLREHPLTHVINPQVVKLRIDETEEKLRTGEIKPDEREKAIVAMAADCAELHQYDKAIARLSEVMRQRGAPDAYLINQMAIYSGNLGDEEREEKLYREAIAADEEGGASWFNLALLMRKQKRLDEAKGAIEHAIAADPDNAPYYVLQARIVQDLGKAFAVEQFLEIGLKRFPPLAQQSAWELHWYQSAAELRKDEETIEAVRRERHRREAGKKELFIYDVNAGVLPDLAEGEAKVRSTYQIDNG